MTEEAAPRKGSEPGPGKPTVTSLGIDVAALDWQRSGTGDGSIEVAFIDNAAGRTQWVLMRVAGDPAGRVLVYDRHEWECFLDGVRKAEFDQAAEG
jgi:hypothetical protein